MSTTITDDADGTNCIVFDDGSPVRVVAGGEQLHGPAAAALVRRLVAIQPDDFDLAELDLLERFCVAAEAEERAAPDAAPDDGGEHRDGGQRQLIAAFNQHVVVVVSASGETALFIEGAPIEPDAEIDVYDGSTQSTIRTSGQALLERVRSEERRGGT